MTVLHDCAAISSQLLNQKLKSINRNPSPTLLSKQLCDWLCTSIACLALTVKLEDLSSLFCLQNWPFHLRACSHEPGTVNYPGVMIALGQALPRVHMMICCPGATLPRVNFIAPGQVYRHLITTNLSEFLYI